jgi:uncharacterized ParB-like nuclease family protein
MQPIAEMARQSLGIDHATPLPRGSFVDELNAERQPQLELPLQPEIQDLTSQANEPILPQQQLNIFEAAYDKILVQPVNSIMAGYDKTNASVLDMLDVYARRMSDLNGGTGYNEFLSDLTNVYVENAAKYESVGIPKDQGFASDAAKAIYEGLGSLGAILPILIQLGPLALPLYGAAEGGATEIKQGQEYDSLIDQLRNGDFPYLDQGEFIKEEGLKDVIDAINRGDQAQQVNGYPLLKQTIDKYKTTEEVKVGSAVKGMAIGAAKGYLLKTALGTAAKLPKPIGAPLVGATFSAESIAEGDWDQAVADILLGVGLSLTGGKSQSMKEATKEVSRTLGLDKKITSLKLTKTEIEALKKVFSQPEGATGDKVAKQSDVEFVQSLTKGGKKSPLFREIFGATGSKRIPVTVENKVRAIYNRLMGKPVTEGLKIVEKPIEKIEQKQIEGKEQPGKEVVKETVEKAKEVGKRPVAEIKEPIKGALKKGIFKLVPQDKRPEIIKGMFPGVPENAIHVFSTKGEPSSVLTSRSFEEVATFGDKIETSGERLSQAFSWFKGLNEKEQAEAIIAGELGFGGYNAEEIISQKGEEFGDVFEVYELAEAINKASNDKSLEIFKDLLIEEKAVAMDSPDFIVPRGIQNILTSFEKEFGLTPDTTPIEKETELGFFDLTKAGNLVSGAPRQKTVDILEEDVGEEFGVGFGNDIIKVPGHEGMYVMVEANLTSMLSPFGSRLQGMRVSEKDAFELAVQEPAPKKPIVEPKKKATPKKSVKKDKVAVIDVPVSKIEHGESAMPGGKLTLPGANDLIKKYAEMKTELPPIEAIAPDKKGGKWMVYDGSHRLEAAKLRGDKTIKVIEIGAKPVEKKVAPKKKTSSRRKTEDSLISGGAESPGAKTTETIRKTEIIKYLEKEFGVPIRRKLTQRMGKAVGKYWTDAEMIRTVYEDLPTISHEVAHHIDKKLPDGWKDKLPASLHIKLKSLDYDKKKRRASEGFAELIRHWAVEDDLHKVSPKLNTWFETDFKRDNPEIFAKLVKLKGKMKVWNEQGAISRVLSHIDYKGEHAELTPLDKIRKSWHKIYDEWFDIYDPAQRGVKAFTKKTGKKLRPSQDPFKLATFYKLKSHSIAQTMIEKGMINEQGEFVGKSLVEILKPIVATSNPKELLSPASSVAVRDFVGYAVALRGKEWLTRDKPINPGFSLKDAEFTIKALHTPERHKAAQELTTWANQLQDWVIRAANIPAEDVKKIRDANPIYVPFFRFFVSESDNFNAGSTSSGTGLGATAKGSTRPIINPLESLINMSHKVVEMAHKQQIANSIVAMTEIEGAGEFVDKIARPVKGFSANTDEIIEKLFDVGIMTEGEPIDASNIISFFRGASDYKGRDNVVVVWRGVPTEVVNKETGEKETVNKVKPLFYEVSPEFYSVLSDTPTEFQFPAARLLAGAARLKRMGATQLSPSFALLANPLRDIPFSLLTSKKAFPTPIGPLMGVIKDIFASKKSKSRKYSILGGEMATMSGYDRDATTRMLDLLLLESGGLKGKGLAVVKHPINFIRGLFQVMEMGPRISEFDASMKRYQSKKYKDKGWTYEDALTQSILDGQDLTVNFTRGGSKSMPLNSISAFFNVQLQSIDKLGREIHDNPTRFTLRGLMWLTMPALYFWNKNKDKEWYKSQPPASKYNNLWVEHDSTVYKIPLPFEVGSIFAAAPTALLDHLYMKDPRAIEGLMDNIYGNFTPNVMPSLFAPAVDIKANKDWLNRPIESLGLQSRPVAERYNDRTSTIAKDISKGMVSIFGSKFNPGWSYSPIQIDYLLNNYSGGIYNKLRNTYRSTHKANASDLPVIGRFILRNRDKPTRQINDFYERKNILEELNAVDQLTGSDAIEYTYYKDIYNNYIKPLSPLIQEASKGEDKKLLKDLYLTVAEAIKQLNLVLYSNQFAAPDDLADDIAERGVEIDKIFEETLKQYNENLEKLK